MKNIWKNKADDKMLDLLLPEGGEGVGSEIAVGKMYASILIQDCFRRFAKKKFEKEARDIMAARADSSFALMAGLREFHESGPELKRTISGQLTELIDTEDPTVRRNVPFFGGVGPYVKLKRAQRPHDIKLFSPEVRRKISAKQQQEFDHAVNKKYKKVKAAESIIKRAIKEQGLNSYCDEQFVKAEMAEAINMSPAEFDEVATRLLQAEERGEVQLPMSSRAQYSSLLFEDYDPMDTIERVPTPPVRRKRR